MLSLVGDINVSSGYQGETIIVFFIMTTEKLSSKFFFPTVKRSFCRTEASLLGTDEQWEAGIFLISECTAKMIFDSQLKPQLGLWTARNATEFRI